MIIALLVLGTSGVVTVTGTVARSWPLVLALVASILSTVSFIAAGRLMLGANEQPRMISLVRGVYLGGIAVCASGGGMALTWAAFHSDPIDGVAILGGALLVFGGFTLSIGSIQARRHRIP
jgi:hypothetical protein